MNKQLKRYYRNIYTKYPNAIKQMPEKRKYIFQQFFIIFTVIKLLTI